MSSAFLWILLPIAVGAALLLYRRKDDTPLYLAIGLSFILTWIAWQFPIDVVLQLGSISIEIAPTLTFLGRNFTLAETQRLLLTFIYLAQTLWLLGAFLTRPGQLFPGLSLIAVGLFMAALAVQPFLYAALFLAAAFLVWVPLLVPPGTQPGRGMQRALIFLLFSVPCILFTGWLLTGVEGNPGNFELVLRAGLLMALGFSFLLALFPFHSWVPMLAQETAPYVLGFLTFFLRAVALIFLLSFVERYVWLRDNPAIFQLLLAMGSLGVFLGGVWASQQRHLGRMMAFAGMLATGGLLQAIGLGGAVGLQTFFALLLPQAWVLWALAASLAVLHRHTPSLQLEELGPALRRHPLLALTAVAALVALAGLPLLGPFAAHLAIWHGVGQQSVGLLILSFLGSLGLLAGGLRLLHAWLTAAPEPRAPVGPVERLPFSQRPDMANPYVWVFSLIWLVTLLGYGLLPSFLAPVQRLVLMFPQVFQ
ncbi:MAG TPA: proton-conducting transporter membrane subunit [Anaerolineales bacterium]|nr:proton-conducting transporter membrane subunit [Anaerolineales bacterium]HRQ92061.1 proton-conducting transporter membrane subunit [Anaerolineales bacterium]